MSELFIHENNRDFAHEWLDQQLADSKPKKLKVSNTRQRSLPQNALQHMWYGEISVYLIKSGRDDWTPAKVKKNLKNTFLGCVAVNMTDMKTGEVTTQYELRKSSELDRGESHHYSEQILAWASQLDITLTIPNNSEFFINREAQDG